MEHVLKIEGMMCMHCSGRVQKALEQSNGVETVAVDLENGTATVKGGVAEELKAAVEKADYKVLSID